MTNGAISKAFKQPTLTTKRLRLRRWRPDDLAPFAAMNCDPRVMEFFVKTMTPAECEARVAKYEAHFDQHGFGSWVVERLEDGAFLGMTGLHVPKFEAYFTPCVEIGWRFNFESWGQGYATEAANAALDYGFNIAGLLEIVSFTVPANLRSRRVMERLGMTHARSERFEHPDIPEGPIKTHVLYRLPKERFAVNLSATIKLPINKL